MYSLILLAVALVGSAKEHTCVHGTQADKVR